MKSLLLSLSLLFFTTVLSAQNAPIDFESGGNGADWTWTVFENDSNPPLEIIENPDQSGANTSSTVAKFTATASGAPFAGVESSHGSADLGGFVLDESNSTIKIMVWKSVISDVGIKLVAPTGWSQPEKKVANTQVNQWEELTFDFSDYLNPPASEGQLDQIVVFPDFGDRSEEHIIYFDNITFSAADNSGGGGDNGDGVVNYCDSTVYHLGSEAETASAIKLTIVNVDEQSMKVEIESANDDPVDDLIVNNISGPITGSPAVSEVTNTDGVLSRTLTWTSTPPTEVELNVLWSKASFDGNWQLGTENTTVSFSYTCDGTGGGGGGDDEPVTGELVTNGDFESGNEGSWYGNAVDIRTEGDNSYNFADVQTAGNAFDVNLSQLVDISPSETYIFEFDASTSEGNTRDMVVGIGQSAAPFYANVETVTLADTMQTYSFELDAIDDGTGNPFGSENSRVIFDMGAEVGVVVIDNVSLELKVETSNEERTAIPEKLSLAQNYPNPFNPSTTIAYSLASAGDVTLEVFNIQGQKVATLVEGMQSAGSHTATFNATGLSSGLYVYRLTSGNFTLTNKMTLIK